MVAVAIAVRLVFISIFFLGASLQNVPLNKSENWIFSTIRSHEEWLSQEESPPDSFQVLTGST